jgi:hypothetical protein
MEIAHKQYSLNPARLQRAPVNYYSVGRTHLPPDSQNANIGQPQSTIPTTPVRASEQEP